MARSTARALADLATSAAAHGQPKQAATLVGTIDARADDVSATRLTASPGAEV